MKSQLTFFKKLAVVMALALSFGLASQAQAFRKGRLARKLRFMAKKIGVSAETVEKIKAMWINKRRRMRGLRKKMRRARRKLRRLIYNRATTRDIIIDKVNQLNALKSKMRMNRTLMKFRISRLLTPAQLKVLKKLKRRRWKRRGKRRGGKWRKHRRGRRRGGHRW